MFFERCLAVLGLHLDFLGLQKFTGPQRTLRGPHGLLQGH